MGMHNLIASLIQGKGKKAMDSAYDNANEVAIRELGKKK